VVVSPEGVGDDDGLCPVAQALQQGQRHHLTQPMTQATLDADMVLRHDRSSFIARWYMVYD
jgi:hypothetical protein